MLLKENLQPFNDTLPFLSSAIATKTRNRRHNFVNVRSYCFDFTIIDRNLLELAVARWFQIPLCDKDFNLFYQFHPKYNFICNICDFPSFTSVFLFVTQIRFLGYNHMETSRKGGSREQAPNPPFLPLFVYTQCSSIFSINIPYPLVESCINTWVTAPISFPSWMIGLPDMSESSKGQYN